MKVSKKELRQLIEQALHESDDAFAEQLVPHQKASLELAAKLKDHVFAAKQIAEKAQRYGTPSGQKLKQYDQMLDVLYGFMNFLKK